MNKLPYVETQRSTQVSDVSQQDGSADLMVNNLVYQQPAALSLAVARTYKKMFFQRNTYTGDRSSTMICDWNTGTSFVNLQNSYISFKVKVNSANNLATANWGSGSAMNIFNELRIMSRSGTEMDRLQNANLWSKNDSLYTLPNGYLTTVGSVQGFGALRDAASDVANLNNTEKRFCIPLTALSTFFRPMKKQLLPPQLASGLHFEMVLEDFRTALYQKVGVLTGYDISGLYFMLDCVDLTDDCQKTISMESAQDGLEYTYERIFTSVSQVPISQLSVSQQVRKAVSQACYATTVTISQADRIDVTKDSLNSIPFNYSSFQYRIGALYFPNQEVSDAQDGVEAYIITQQVYDKLKHPYAEGAVTLANFKAVHGVLSASFEKDTNLSVSGLPINNSRTLELNTSYVAVAEALEVITFLQYVSVARCFTDNIATAI
jgi:hypothetical protein